MEFIKPDINIDFISKRYIAYGVSAIAILISILTLIVQGGPRFGIDFSGGTVIQIRFAQSVPVDSIKTGLGAVGIESPTIQTFGEAKGHEYMVRTDLSLKTDEQFSTRIQQALKESTGQDAEIRRVEMVGPQVGQDLREKALFAIFYALLFIAIYISGRFEFKWIQCGIIAAALMGGVYFLSLMKLSMAILITLALILTLILFWVFQLRYAMGAVVSLLHDVMITLGFFVIAGGEFSLPIVAALLAIIGYSLNDTIIVYDRIRENLKKHRKLPFEKVINRSVNETLSRTILTVGTTLVSVLALYIWGGGIIHDFAFVMIVGILVGTFSSIFVASPILLVFQDFSKKK
ncbi:MAG: protein translocase subunit SecF [Desulfatirhabdiaceae bacterium]